LWDHFRATPEAASGPALFLLGSSAYSAQLAGYLGLPFAFAHHFDTGGTLQAATLYEQAFAPSSVLDSPYLIVTANVLTADTKEEAEWHSAPSRLAALGRRTGRFMPLRSPHAAAEHPDLAEANSLPSNRIVGEIATVIAEVEDLAARTGAAEVMVTSVAYDLSARIRNLELLADHWVT
jgi:luciferase family oxidoreductase group 1